MHEQNKLTRRKMLSVSLAFGGYTLLSPLSHLLAQQRMRRTPDQILGPFYPMIKPLDQDADLTIINGRTARSKGQVINLMGRVFNIYGKPIEGARVEIWQANASGRYNHPDDNNSAPLDPNFLGYGMQITNREGQYRFKTIKPGAYPAAGGSWTRAPHIHFKVTGRTNQFVTQMYFDGEPLNDKDRFLQSVTNTQMLITKLLPPTKDSEQGSLTVNWDIILLSG